jgi:hypothetical protein
MAYRANLSRSSFEIALTPESLRTTQIIQSALMAGVVFYAVAALLIYTQNQDRAPSASELDTLQILTVVHLVFFGAAVVASMFLSKRLFSPQGMAQALESKDARQVADRCVVQQRTAILVRLAVLEGAAFFGLSVCTIGAQSGGLRESPAYWINLVSGVGFLFSASATFPTRERLVNWFEAAFLKE